MKSLWARIGGQSISSCGCSRCLCDQWGITRRWNCSFYRYMLRRHGTGTYLYSGIFAAGVAIDASIKKSTAQELEDTLAKAKQEVKSIKRELLIRQRALLQTPQAEEVITRLAQESDTDLEESLWNQPADVILDAAWTPPTQVPLTLAAIKRFGLHAGAERPEWPIGKERFDGDDDHLPPQSLWSSKTRRSLHAQTEWTRKKLNAAEFSVARFVLLSFRSMRLFDRSESQLQRLPESLRPYAQLSKSEQGRILEEMDNWHRTVHFEASSWEHASRPDLRITIPNYTTGGNNASNKDSRRLQAAVAEAFKWFEGEVVPSENNHNIATPYQLLIRLCAVLLESSAAPDITTYNQLLVGFSFSPNLTKGKKRFLLHRLKEFQHWTKLRPNEITHTTMLRQLRLLHQPKEWSGYLSAMRGENNKSHTLARRDLPIDDAVKRSVKEYFDNDNRVIVRQMCHPMPMIYVEMIRGLLTFGGFEQAYKVLHQLRPEGWTVDWECLQAFLFDCIQRQAWDNGLSIWREIQALGRETKKIPDYIYAAVLALCRRCDKREEFDIVLREAKGLWSKTIFPTLQNEMMHIIDWVERDNGRASKAREAQMAHEQYKQRVVKSMEWRAKAVAAYEAALMLKVQTAEKVDELNARHRHLSQSQRKGEIEGAVAANRGARLAARSAATWLKAIDVYDPSAPDEGDLASIRAAAADAKRDCLRASCMASSLGSVSNGNQKERVEVREASVGFIDYTTVIDYTPVRQRATA